MRQLLAIECISFFSRYILTILKNIFNLHLRTKTWRYNEAWVSDAQNNYVVILLFY